MLSMRNQFLLGAVMCAGMIAIALYFQHVEMLEPCPLCIVQRVIVIALGVVFLIAGILNPQALGQRLWAGLLSLIALTGVGVAARHVWLQNLPPDQVPECGPGLDYMMDVLPINEVLSKVFSGSGECAEILWSFLGISIPGWTLITFTLIAAYSLRVVFKK